MDRSHFIRISPIPLLLTWILSGCTLQVDAVDYVSACNPNYSRCADNEIQECRSDGSGFDVVQTCESTERCIELECIPNLEAASIPLPGASQGQNALEEGESGGEATTATQDPIPPYVFDGTVIRIQFQITESTPGGFMDMGLCNGIPLIGVGDDTYCEEALFLRIADDGNVLRAGVYTDSAEETTLQEIPGTQASLKREDIYTFLLTIQPYSIEEESSVTTTLTLIGNFSGAIFQTNSTLISTRIGAVGIWNFDEDSGPEKALAGNIVNTEFLRGEEFFLSTPEFLQYAAIEGISFQINPDSHAASFYLSGKEENSALLSLEYLDPKAEENF